MRFITGFELCLVLNFAAVLWGCGRLADPAVIDRIFWRNLVYLRLELVSGFHAPSFIDANGDPLSDHPPIAAKFRWSHQSLRK